MTAPAYLPMPVEPQHEDIEHMLQQTIGANNGGPVFFRVVRRGTLTGAPQRQFRIWWEVAEPQVVEAVQQHWLEFRSRPFRYYSKRDPATPVVVTYVGAPEIGGGKFPRLEALLREQFV